MTVLARHVRATPYRYADEAWELIVELLAVSDGPAREELLMVGGVASSLIASEAAKDDPVVIYGGGPRVRIYCLYDEKAVTGDGMDERKLPISPTDGDWLMSLPCPEEDLRWVNEALGKKTKRITARKLGEAVQPDANGADQNVTARVVIDEEAFFRP